MTDHDNKLSPSMTLDAKRKRAQRQRLREAGLQPYEIWLKGPAEWEAVKRFIERLRARK